MNNFSIGDKLILKDITGKQLKDHGFHNDFIDDAKSGFIIYDHTVINNQFQLKRLDNKRITHNSLDEWVLSEHSLNKYFNIIGKETKQVPEPIKTRFELIEE